MWAKRLLTRSSKAEVILTTSGMGIIEFQVPPLTDDVRLKLTHFETDAGRQPKKKRSGAFYAGIILEGFKKQGGISIDGWLHPPENDAEAHPDFRTMIQADGDIICKVNRSLFARRDCREFINGYVRVRNQFLDELFLTFRTFVKKILVVGGIGVSIAGILKMILPYVMN